VGGSVKCSLAMALPGYGATIAKACGLDAATRVNRHSWSHATHGYRMGRTGA